MTNDSALETAASSPQTEGPRPLAIDVGGTGGLTFGGGPPLTNTLVFQAVAVDTRVPMTALGATNALAVVFGQ